MPLSLKLIMSVGTAPYDMNLDFHCVRTTWTPGFMLFQRARGIRAEDITVARPAALGPPAWDSHLDLLRTSYPDWIFDSGYLSG